VSTGFCLECGTALEARHHEDRDRPTCPACGFIHYLDPKVAVAVVLGDERGVLLGRRCIDPGSGRWSFPPGYVNRGEVLEEAAVRGSRRVGVAVRLSAGRRVLGTATRYPDGVCGGSPGRTKPDQHSEVRRFALDNLPFDLAFPTSTGAQDWKRAVDSGRLIAN
jgi:ADP-ribose pyrophosphatase YjhB (NUDIX family)